MLAVAHMSYDQDWDRVRLIYDLRIPLVDQLILLRYYNYDCYKDHSH